MMCSCHVNLDLMVNNYDDQHGAFNMEEDKKDFCIFVVYDSTNYIRRRKSWHNLYLMQQ